MSFAEDVEKANLSSAIADIESADDQLEVYSILSKENPELYNSEKIQVKLNKLLDKRIGLMHWKKSLEG